MLVPLSELLKDAERNRYAVGSFNTPNLETLRAVVEAAEITNTPVTLNHASAHNDIIPLEEIAPIMLAYARNSKVPMSVHIDHGKSELFVHKAVRLGFTSIMYDCSDCSFEENVTRVKKFVELAHPLGITVEAELGNMILSAGDGGDPSKKKEDYYTDPTKAAEFCEKTGVDCLAITFGTEHGIGNKPQMLDIERLKQIKEKVGDMAALVMHGGSGTPAEEIKKAVMGGIRKINYFSAMDVAATEAVKARIEKEAGKPVHYADLTYVATEMLKNKCIEAIKMFNSVRMN